MKQINFEKAAVAAGLGLRAGKQALKSEHKDCLGVSGGVKYTGSVDLDRDFKNRDPSASRWDYGVGFNDGKEFVFWIEVHSASRSDDYKSMEKKLSWLQYKLNSPEFRDLKQLTEASSENGEKPFKWVSVGKVEITRNDKYRKRLADRGLDFPTRKLRVTPRRGSRSHSNRI